MAACSRAVRWARTGNKYRAMRDAGNAGRVLGWSLAAIGLVMMFNGMSGIFSFVIGVFIALNARAEIMTSYIGEQLDGVKVRDLTWFGVAQAGTDMDADSMIYQRQRLGDAGAVVVVGDDGELDGLVLEDQLWAIPTERRAMVMLTQLMTPFNTLAKAAPDEDLASVLPRLNPLRPSSPCGTTASCSGSCRRSDSRNASPPPIGRPSSPDGPDRGPGSDGQAAPTVIRRP